MHRFFIPKPYKQEMQITGRDAHHIMDVLRNFADVARDNINPEEKSFLNKIKDLFK